MPPAAQVSVLGFKDPDGNWGLSFHGVFADMPGGGLSDALLRFMVQVNADQARLGTKISDAHLFLNGVGADTNSVFTVDESYLENSTTLSTYYSTLGPQPVQKLQDSKTFATPVVKLNVTKDIFAFAGGPNLPARATDIDQSFSQTSIPEPATLGMLALASLGLVGFIQRRK
jgi:hypothetical protein